MLADIEHEGYGMIRLHTMHLKGIIPPFILSSTAYWIFFLN